MQWKGVLEVCAVLFVSTSLGQPTSSDDQYSEEKRAIDWLVGERLPDWGWGGLSTAYALIALQVVEGGEKVSRELSAKQLEIDLVLQLWRHHETPALTSAQLALYALALTSSCQDPRQFHGIDLIGSLLHHSEPDSDSEFAVCSLAMCSAGTHVRKRPLRRLLNIANTKHIDSLSGVILALKCIVRDHRNRNLQHYLKKPISVLARSQLPDGSFGNVYSTSLAIQALGEDTTSWNRSAAVGWLKSHQRPDGSFDDVSTTAHALMALYGKGMGSIRDIDCERPDQDEKEVSAVIVPHVPVVKKPEVSPKGNGTRAKEGNETRRDEEEAEATVSYTLWVGTNVTENRTTTLTVPHNFTFYNLMQLAAHHDPKYAFAATEWPNGHYVHTLAGFKEQPMSYHYWLLYRLNSLPDPSSPPGNQYVAPTGVDDLIVKDGEHYLFWYKKL